MEIFSKRSSRARFTSTRRFPTTTTGRSARAVMDGTVVAQFGEIHPDIAASASSARMFSLPSCIRSPVQHDLRERATMPCPVSGCGT